MNWIQDLELITRQFQSAFGHLSAAQLNWKPSADRWSIGQIVDHLITTNSTFFPILGGLRAGTYQPHPLAKLPLLANLFGKMILGSVQPESKRKVKTFTAFEPSQSAIPGDILQKFAEHQFRLTDEIRASQLWLDRVISSPASRIVVYRLDRAFDVLVTHERRHFMQAREVLALIPSASTAGT